MALKSANNKQQTQGVIMKNEITMFKTTCKNNHVIGAMVINDYSNIITPEWNREFVPKGLLELRKSMDSNGVLTAIGVVKIKSTNQYMIIEGNHRNKITQEKGYSLSAYIIDIKATGMTENELMIWLNTTPKNWKPADFLNNGIVYHSNENYTFLRDILEETGVKLGALYLIYSYENSNAKNKELFELGKWRVTTRRLGNRVIRYAQELIDQNLIPFAKHVNFLRGFVVCVNKKGYNQSQMIKQCKRFKNHIHDNDKPAQHREMLNKVYNHLVLEEEELYLDK